MEKIILNGQEFNLTVRRVSGRSSRVRLRSGGVEIGVSRFLDREGEEKIVKQFLSWAEKRLEKMSLEVKDFVNPRYVDGESIRTHNCTYSLRIIADSGREKVKSEIDENCITLWIPQYFDRSKIAGYVEKIIIKEQTPYLKEVIDELNQLHFQEKFADVRFKKVKSRFGSCSSKRNINIAYRLLFAPREVFRYVCVHELAHLKEFNHSSRFWALVESAMPDYRKQEEWLKKKGFMLG